ncbi:MAG: acyltransferase [Coriobacteriia bacterium]|nr:acyltransferase [Coriobacteriia bacterium]
MWTRLKSVAWWLRVRLAGEYTRGAVFRKQGARIGDGCRLLIDYLGSEPYLVEIGDETLVSSGVQFFTHDGGIWAFGDSKPEVNRFKPVRIGSRCFIGAESILLPGTDIGDRTIIGAGSVVTGKIPAGVVAAGVPARVIGTTEQYMKKAEAESLPLRVPFRSSADERQQLVELLMTPDGAQD